MSHLLGVGALKMTPGSKLPKKLNSNAVCFKFYPHQVPDLKKLLHKFSRQLVLYQGRADFLPDSD